MEQPLPDDFRPLMRGQLGDEEAERLFAALETAAPTSIRLNRAKAASGCAESFPGGATSATVPWCTDGRYLAERPQFTLDPLLHAGCYYVQEAASMAVAQVPLPEPPDGRALRVLDLCAAPGGKSTLWAGRLAGARGLLVCNEPVRSRASVLAENVAKWGLPDVAVTNAYPKDFAPLAGFFDIVAADVPCSGEGMFRKDAGARAEWSLANVRMCAERQFSIVRDVWPTLRPGGLLVYSTCTFNRFEDEDNVRRICEELGAAPLPLPPMAGTMGTDYGQHFYPHRTRGEGFFLALLRKDADGSVRGDAAALRKSHRRSKGASLPREAETLRAWLRTPTDFTLLSPDGERVFALRTALLPDYERLAALPPSLVMERGIALARRKGSKWVPQQPLALSVELASDAFPRAELPRDMAIAYLRRETVALSADIPRGYVVVCYHGHPLGFVHNLGARANNLYPAEWRIRKQL